jgi:integrase
LIAECSKGRAPGTVNRVTAALSAVLHLAKRREWMSSVPYIRKLDEGNNRIRWITKLEAARLLDELPGHLNTMAAFTLATGLRASNVQYLQWSNVSMERRTLWIDAADFKSGKTHSIPLSNDAMTILRGQVGVHHAWVFPYNDHAVDKVSTRAWHSALKRAGISDFRWHDLRHTWASLHVQNGTPLEVLMQLGGWNSYEMVLRYAHLSQSHIARYAQNSHSQISTDLRESGKYNENNNLLGWLTGLEPATTGITIQDSTN